MYSESPVNDAFIVKYKKTKDEDEKKYTKCKYNSSMHCCCVLIYQMMKSEKMYSVSLSA
jgi:hypothetical protein